jgi:hypothetical protein
MKPLFILACITLVIEIFNSIHRELSLNNYYILHIYTIIEFTFISLFYRRFFSTHFKENITLLLIFVLLITSYIDYKVTGLLNLDDISLLTESIILSCYALFSFYYILKNLLYEDLINSDVFWVNCGIIIYFSGNLVLFAFDTYLLNTLPEKHNIVRNSLHSFTNISYNIVIGIAFWKIKPR